VITGNGLLAKAFRRKFENDQDIYIFACGVSNSSETELAEFKREQKLLEDALRTGTKLVYFSCCALINPSIQDTPYLSHKRDMEAKVLASSSSNLVIRLPQVVGNTSNPNTLTNYLAFRIINGMPFSVWTRAERNLIDIDDIACIGGILIRNFDMNEQIVTIAADRSMPMPEIVMTFEKVLEKKANYTMEDKGQPLPIDNLLCMSIAKENGINLGDNYAERIIRKYYSLT